MFGANHRLVSSNKPKTDHIREQYVYSNNLFTVVYSVISIKTSIVKPFVPVYPQTKIKRLNTNYF